MVRGGGGGGGGGGEDPFTFEFSRGSRLGATIVTLEPRFLEVKNDDEDEDDNQEEEKERQEEQE